jgi:YHS domain-containing protein
MKEDKILLFEANQKMKDIIIQAKYMVDGLTYHFSNIERLYSSFKTSNNKHLINCEEISIAIKHEVVAYLNRLGQFYFFAKSKRVKDLLSNPLSDLEFIDRIIVFRMKQTAHRASDAPKSDDKYYDIESLDKRFSSGSLTINDNLIFDIYLTEKKEHISFDPLKEHKKVMQEINDFFEKLNSKIHKEDSEILNGELCKWLINELYVVMYFAEGDNRLDILLDNNKYEEEDVKCVIAHLIAIDWVFKHNAPKKTYLLKRKMLPELEKRNLIKNDAKQLVLENKKRVLETLYLAEKQKSLNLNCKLLGANGMEKDSSSFTREDLGEEIDFMAFYKEDLKDSGHLSKDYKLTELGRSRILQLKKITN